MYVSDSYALIPLPVPQGHLRTMRLSTHRASIKGDKREFQGSGAETQADSFQWAAADSPAKCRGDVSDGVPAPAPCQSTLITDS